MIKITDRIKTFEDACKHLGIEKLNLFLDLPSYMNEYAKFHIASVKLTIITRALNENWIPDWNNPRERRYYAWFTMDSDRGFGLHAVSYHADLSIVSGWLVYQNEELAKYSATQFKDIWEVYMRYNKK